MTFLHRLLPVILILAIAPAFAQQAPADNFEVLRDKLRADKKLVVADNMGLTESEAKAFWPVYEAYQADLKKLNERLGKLIESYAAAYQGGAVSDEQAKQLVNQFIALEEDETKLKKSYVPKLSKVLPMVKVGRYLQIESKIRSVLKFELADAVPLVR
jgi:hypothetical protein